MRAAECATLACAVTDLEQRGFTADLRAVDGGLRAGAGQTFPSSELVIREIYRFEGVSDPDDMEVVYAIESSSGMRGTLVDAFGVYADPATGLALETIPIRRLRSP